ncbi:MAG: hypothetical protein LUG16_06145 [Candidatus Gastranaerophilales bacterium]|nr:hypothetical protein [Candidatus Gastranaerophilales bacterium]
MLKNILETSNNRYISMFKLYQVLPGSPTDFAGDRVGSSGYETKAKNYAQQNRNTIHWEWLDEKDYKFVQDNYNKLNEVANIRKQKGLSALNDGATVTLPLKNEFVQAFLRYNDDSMVIALTDLKGMDAKPHEEIDRKNIKCSEIQNIPLNIDGATLKQGLKHGLKVGTKFKNARQDDLGEYIVRQNKQGEYYLQKVLVQPSGISNTNIKIEPDDYNTLILYKVK